MQNPSSSVTTDLVQVDKFLPIAPRNENLAVFPPGKKYDTLDFVTTVLSMREKLYELQGDLWDAEEPTQDKDILKRWKASNNIIHGNMNGSNLFFVKVNPFNNNNNNNKNIFMQDDHFSYKNCYQHGSFEIMLMV